MTDYAKRVVDAFPTEITDISLLRELPRVRDASVHFYYPTTNTIYTTSIMPMLGNRVYKNDDTSVSNGQLRAWSRLPPATKVVNTST